MSESDVSIWHEQNREFLALAIEQLHARMDQDPAEAVSESEQEISQKLEALYERMHYTPALLRLSETFELDQFECDVVLFCAASEIDPRFRSDQLAPTVGLVLESLPGAYWAALDAGATLRRSGVIEVDTGGPLAAAPLRAAPDVIRYLLGFDPRVGGSETFTIAAPPGHKLPSQAEAAQDLARTVTLALAVTQAAPGVELYGGTEEDRRALAALCAAELGGAIASADARDLPAPGAELDELLSRWNRWSALTATLLLVSGSDADEDPATRHRVSRMLDLVQRPFFISVRRPTTVEPTRTVIRRAALELTAEERAGVWTACVDAARARLQLRQAKSLRAEISDLSTQFRLSPRAIERICLEAESLQAEVAPDASGGVSAAEHFAAQLRQGCSRAVRARLDPLAERVPLDDIAAVALPKPERDELDELERQIRLSYEVNMRWGMGHGRDSGLTALFAGPSGTGKTHAAMELARRTGLDLYRINVAAVLSKYIGETEQNLDRIFEAARVGGVILLFDEADALFGKRTEAKDAHDRYANLGTAYLLQRIEHSPTPTILTTNLKDGLDPAFTRRLHFVIDFPFPDEEGREHIWASIFPPQAPVSELEPGLLAQLAVTGGTINSIARRGAFLAAADTGRVEMRHLREGAVRELKKTGRELGFEETAGW